MFDYWTVEHYASISDVLKFCFVNCWESHHKLGSISFEVEISRIPLNSSEETSPCIDAIFVDDFMDIMGLLMVLIEILILHYKLYRNMRNEDQENQLIYILIQ
jgi:hypothetical protein